MKGAISEKSAANILILLLASLLSFHLLVLIKVVPSNIIWGGQITDSSDNMMRMEIFAIIVTIIFISIVSAKIGYIKTCISGKIINILLWIIFIFFAFNTVGNLVSGVSIEKLIFAPITVLLSLLTLRLAIEK